MNTLCESLHTLYDINFGGCCYTAYCIAKALEQFNVEFSLVVFDRIQNLKYIKSIKDLHGSVDHCAIVLPDNANKYQMINCDSEDFKGCYQTYATSSSEILEYYLSNEWNDRYNSDYNTLVQHQIERICYEFSDNLC